MSFEGGGGGGGGRLIEYESFWRGCNAQRLGRMDQCYECHELG